MSNDLDEAMEALARLYGMEPWQAEKLRQMIEHPDTPMPTVPMWNGQTGRYAAINAANALAAVPEENDR